LKTGEDLMDHICSRSASAQDNNPWDMALLLLGIILQPTQHFWWKLLAQHNTS